MSMNSTKHIRELHSYIKLFENFTFCFLLILGIINGTLIETQPIKKSTQNC